MGGEVGNALDCHAGGQGSNPARPGSFVGNSVRFGIVSAHSRLSSSVLVRNVPELLRVRRPTDVRCVVFFFLSLYALVRLSKRSLPASYLSTVFIRDNTSGSD